MWEQRVVIFTTPWYIYFKNIRCICRIFPATKYLPGRHAGARKAFFGFKEWSFQKLFISCVMKLQVSPSMCFCPSSIISVSRRDYFENVNLKTLLSVSHLIIITNRTTAVSCKPFTFTGKSQNSRIIIRIRVISNRLGSYQSHGVVTLFQWNAPSCWAA